ncbi:uncharacterized protein LOC123523665 isoform X1 [Mercenaria mercenaria]|uniref:uncharacterized protein LOC123523665 isoform X1 n=1 Tax=Mercenaria mercenaria TaxID=6596 RepID=UPI00234F69AA|nr:uncharacterized protein LOC123523665 isoform X1 [Mercenaria mercenaria]
MSKVLQQNCTYICDFKRKMKAIIVVVCITVAVLQSLEGVVVAKDNHKAKDNADNSIGNMKARFRNIVTDDEKPEENDQSSSKLGSRDTTGVRILYPFRIILSTLGEVSNALSTLVHTLVTVFDYCLRIPATVVKVLLCGFIDATLYLLLDIILKVVVNRGLIIIIWIPYEIFDFMLNTMPLEDIITKYVSIAYFILREVVLKITIVCYWLSVFIVITSLTCYILYQARIITVQQLPTGRQAISTILRTMTFHNLKLWMKDITTMQYTFIILLTSFISFHSFYTFIPACNYILRNLVLKTVPVIYWVLVVIVTSYMLCKMCVLLYKQKHFVLNPVSLRLSSLWNFVCTNKAMTWILHRVFDRPVCHVVYNAIHACFKSVVGHKSIRRTLSMVQQNFLSIRSNFLYISMK